MNKQRYKKNILSSRRKILKNMGKATTFFVPTLATFNISELKAQSSGSSSLPDEPGNPYSK